VEQASAASAACLANHAARYRTHRVKTHGDRRRDRYETCAFWQVCERSRAGIAVAISRHVMNRTSQRGPPKFVEMVMRVLTRFARSLVAGVLAVWVVSLAAPCAAQELETPAAPAGVDASSSLVVPGGFLGVTAPLRQRIALSAYGFYYGDVDVPVAQVDLSVRATKFLTVTPSYLYYEIPPSGLNKSVGVPALFTDSFEENQFRIDGTVKFSIGKFEIADRNMYVRRFRPTDEVNRYRHRIGIAHPFAVNGHIWKAFANHEAFYEWGNGGWNRNRLSAGATLPLQKHVSFQPAYIWDRNRGAKDVHYLQFGLIVSTR